jgi:alkanesulfonate monooxygenase SsuD/methylene tetrahydromethanopterin reductase-like flavin-dependent oxidoreductase (luciferase family)
MVPPGVYRQHNALILTREDDVGGKLVRFGLVEGFGPFAPDQLIPRAVQAESLGFDLLSLPDHLHSSQPTLEPWTALAFAAAATDRITLLTNVLGLPYRSPAVTAKMAETSDRLSGGRLVLALGVGGYDPEFAAFGLGTRSPGEKVAALEEAIKVIRGLWDTAGFTFAGEHFQVEQARIEPRPGHPIPIWTGAYGPRALRVTGALADGWLPSIGRLGLPGAIERKSAVVSALHDAGRGDAPFTFATNVVIRFGAPDGDPAPGWQLLTGTAGAVAERLTEIVRAGFTVLNVVLPGPGDIERFAAEVMPAVRRDAAGLMATD